MPTTTFVSCAAYAAHRHQRGNSMMEVLVSILVLAFGALGVAGLQATSKRAHSEAKQQLVASYLANDIIERMRNNPSVLATYAGAVVGGGSISREPSPSCSSGSPCTAAQLAAHDRWLWEQAIDGATVKYGSQNIGGLVVPRGCISNTNGQVQVVIAWISLTLLSDTGASADGAAGCGDASDQRRQAVFNTYIR